MHAFFGTFAILAVAGCHAHRGRVAESARVAVAVRSEPVAASGLETYLEIRPEVVPGRVPQRRALLHVKNASSSPLRIYLPVEATFRTNISTVYFHAGAEFFMEPEPHPHGYTVTAVDFPLLAPGEERAFEQDFTLDPANPTGAGTARRAGFEDGKTVRVRWVYENALTSWPGGVGTLDGVTRPVWDGGTIPYLWTGKLSNELSWTVR